MHERAAGDDAVCQARLAAPGRKPRSYRIERGCVDRYRVNRHPDIFLCPWMRNHHGRARALAGRTCQQRILGDDLIMQVKEAAPGPDLEPGLRR